MKTAVSIPDEVFNSAENLASQLGQSRSQLYARALNSYIKTHHNDGLTKKLDEVYAKFDSRLDPVLKALQTSSLPKGEW